MLKFFMSIAFWVLSIVVRGFVFKTMWQWFVVPVFHLPYLRLSVAIGLIVLVAGIFTHGNAYKKEEKTKEFLELCLTNIVVCLLILLIGFIVTLFM